MQPCDAKILRPGVSVVVCCYNSANRLPETLAHLVQQEVSENLSWEVVVVDNGSTDNTAGVARSCWPKNSPIPLRVVVEPQVGLSNARQRGFLEANFDLVSFVDDDNWVAPDWVATAAAVMQEHPEAGACGGRTEAVCESPPPSWFNKFQEHYACGAKSDRALDVTERGGFLWGAGITIRKGAWQHLITCGFQPRLVGRRGTSLSGGEDSELCKALRLAGWKLWYDPRLSLRHYMPASRLQWSYLRRMQRGYGASFPAGDPYAVALQNRPKRPSWHSRTVRALARLLVISTRRPQLLLGWAGEGDEVTLQWERVLGRFLTLLRERKWYEQGFRDVYDLRSRIAARATQPA